AQSAEHMGQSPCPPSRGKTQEKKLTSPGQRHTRPARRPTADLFKAAKETAEPQMGEAGKIIASVNDLLHKSGFRIDQPVGFEDAFELANALGRFDDVLQHSLDHHSIKDFVLEGQVTGITNKPRPRTKAYVGFHQFESWCSEQGLHAGSQNASPNH